jgi:Uncharacterised nucleotidyltransferase
VGESPAKAAVNAMLVDACRGNAFEVPAGDGVERDVIQAARFHRVAPLVYVGLRGENSGLAVELRGDRDRAFWHHLRVTAVLDEIARILDGADWLVFKGPVLSELAHPVCGLRTYKDLDILVAPAHFRGTVDRLRDAGWNVVQSNDELRNPEIPGELPMASAAGILLDLHWSMVITNTRRRLYPVDTDALLERRVPLTIGASHLWTLDPADMFVHVCHHAALSGATRLVHLLDADQLARQVTDWDEIARQARTWGATAHVALVLGRARRLLGTPVPSDLEDLLDLPAGFGRIMAVVDRLWPISSLRQDASWPRLAARAASPSVLRTVGVMSRNASMRVVHSLRPQPAPRRRVPGDPDALDGYLSAVESLTRHTTSPT